VKFSNLPQLLQRGIPLLVSVVPITTERQRDSPCTVGSVSSRGPPLGAPPQNLFGALLKSLDRHSCVL